MKTIEQQLADLSNNFSDKQVGVKCHTIEEKQEAVKIFRQYYDIVEPADVTAPGDVKMTWQINCANPKKMNESLIQEADDEDLEFSDEEFDDDSDLEVDGDDDLDLSEFDNPDDDMDLSDENLDSIDDISEVDKAEQIAILKKRAADLSEKWRDIYSQISTLARNLDLVATYDDDLNIELKKADGTSSKYKDDLKQLKDKVEGEPQDEFDDDFGPSEYDARAAEYSQEPEPVQTESVEII